MPDPKDNVWLFKNGLFPPPPTYTHTHTHTVTLNTTSAYFRGRIAKKIYPVMAHSIHYARQGTGYNIEPLI